MPIADRREALFQRLSVQVTGHPHGDRRIVGGVRPFQLIQEPQAFLRERQRQRGRPGHSAQRRRTREALLLAGGLALVAFLLILPLNRLVLELSVVALFLAASYPFTKRFFAIPQAYLGIAFGFGIPMSYAALTGAIPMEAWVLLVANMFWAIAYDTEYALVDREDDLKIGIKTSAITFGRFDIAAIALCYAAALVLLGWVGSRLALGAAYFGGLLIAAGIAAYHLVLIRHRDPAKCFRAFLHNTWFGAAVFGGIVLDYLVQGA